MIIKHIRDGIGRGVSLCMLTCVGALLQPAAAQPFEVNEPTVEEGELEIEVIGAVQFGFPEADDDEEEEAIRHAHEAAVGFGVTEFWKIELGLALEAVVGEAIEATNIEVANTVELFEQETDGFGLSLFVAVEPAIHDDATGEVAFGPIFGVSIAGIETTINPFFEKTFGKNREPGTGFSYAWQSRCEFDEGIGFGIEAFGELENIDEVAPLRDQEHRLGPVVYFETEVGEDQELSIDFGVLFGLTPGTPDVAIKWNVGLEL